MKKIIFLFLGLLLLTFTKPALAVQFKSGNDLTFNKETKIDETIFISGNNIQFDSPLTGDLFCAGRNITITADIKGDVLCAGQNIKVTGDVDGNIRVVGQSIAVEGIVSRNLSVFGQDLTLNSKSNIKGDILFGGQNVDLSGIGGRDLIGAGDKVRISGSLLRNAVITVSSMDFSDSAKVGGNIDYFVDQDNTTTQIMANKNIKGEIRRHAIVTAEKPKVDVEKKVKAMEPGLKILKTIFGIISFTLLSFVLLYFSSKRTAHIIDILNNKPVISGLVGLATLVVAPIALLIICTTVVGLPVAFVLFMMYSVTLFISSVYVSIWIGKMVMARLQPKASSLYLAAFVGCLVVGLISMLPVLGWLVVMVIFLMGLGSSFLSYLPEK